MGRLLECSLLTLVLAPQATAQGAVAGQALDEAPHVFLQADGGLLARWIAAGTVRERAFAAGQPVELPAFADLLGEQLVVSAPEPPPAIWSAPARMLVLSDVEGEYDLLLRFLAGNGVVDERGAWAFGDGHLVAVGDMVDRGEQVTETLWLLYRLSIEAELAGGQVHYILGNHEAMWMGADVRYAHEKYVQSAKLLGVTVEGLVGDDTVLGRWMRTRNCVERIGDYVFVHGGLSAAVVGEGLDFERVNAKVRTSLGVPKNRVQDAEARELIWGRSGPLWYRGYFEQHAEAFGPPPSSAQFQKLLDASGARHIVVGHTKVERVLAMYDGGLIPIDIPWKDPAQVRALLVRGADVSVVDIHGVGTGLQATVEAGN